MKTLSRKFLIALIPILLCVAILVGLNISTNNKLNRSKTDILCIGLLRQAIHQANFSLMKEQYLMMEIIQPESKQELEETYIKHIEIAHSIKRLNVFFTNEINKFSEEQQKDISFDSLKIIFYGFQKYYENNLKCEIDSNYFLLSKLIQTQELERKNNSLVNDQNRGTVLTKRIQFIDNRFDTSCDSFHSLLARGAELATKFIDNEIIKSESATKKITLFFWMIIFLLIFLLIFFAYYIWKLVSEIHTSNCQLKDEIIKRINVEEELRKSNELLTILFEDSPVPLVLYNADGNLITECNRNYLQLIGFDFKNEVIGKTMKELNFLPNLEQEKKIRNKFVGSEKINQDELLISTKHGQNKIVLLTANPVQILDKQSILVSLVDITERKQYEKVIEQMNINLTELNATKDKFFSIIAHDLKNPFAALLSSCELLQRSITKQDVEKIKKFADSIQGASNDAYKLLENLLSWSKLQMNKFELKKEKCNICSIINEALSSLQNIATEKEIKLITSNDKNAEIIFDKEMFKAIIRNFTTNAIKFSNKGANVYIDIHEFNENLFKISIKDTGVGINEKDLPKLFRIDASLSTTGTNNESGTGLGLLLCKEFAEKNNSEIFVESEEGKGSTFSFMVEKAFV